MGCDMVLLTGCGGEESGKQVLPLRQAQGQDDKFYLAYQAPSI
jgi:hypothetical protein